MSDRVRFFELLPFHVNGTLATTDAVWMQREIEQHPELPSQVELMQALRLEVQSAAEASLAGVAADTGYSTLAARIAAARRPVANVDAVNLWQRARAWLLGMPGRPSPGRLGPLASGLVFGVMVGLGIMMALPPQAPTSEMRGVAPGLADGPLLRVTFRPDSRESDLRMALIEARALVVAGPTRLGDYYLKTPPDHLDAARAALRASGLVLQVDQVPSLPPDLLD